MMDKILVLNVEREGYAPDQVRDTMTVGELIRFLEDYDKDRKVYIAHDNHYTFSGIREQNFEDDYEEE